MARQHFRAPSVNIIIHLGLYLDVACGRIFDASDDNERNCIMRKDGARIVEQKGNWGFSKLGAVHDENKLAERLRHGAIIDAALEIRSS